MRANGRHRSKLLGFLNVRRYIDDMSEEPRFNMFELLRDRWAVRFSRFFYPVRKRTLRDQNKLASDFSRIWVI